MFERSFTRQLPKGRIVMSFIKTKDGTEIYYKDWGEGPAVTFSHGWPLNSDMWDGQMLFLAQHGFRAVAHDRRGHGRSSQTSSGNDMDGFADDLAAVIETLDLNDVTLVGHSTGGAEVARYIGRHGTSRVDKALLISAAVPALLRTDANPEGLQKFDVPTLILHGEDDQIVPVQISAMKSAGIIKDAKEIIYPGAPHGITATHQDEINSELVRF